MSYIENSVGEQFLPRTFLALFLSVLFISNAFADRAQAFQAQARGDGMGEYLRFQHFLPLCLL